MSRVLMIAYSGWIHDGRVKRHARALADRGDQIDVICLENPEQGMRDGVNVIGIKLPRYRGSSRMRYLRSYTRFFIAAITEALRRSVKKPYQVVIVCTIPDAMVLCALPCKLFGSKIVLDIHDTMPELYKDKFGGKRGAVGACILRAAEHASTWFANRVLAVHEPHRRRLEEAGVASEKIRVVLNSPDSKVFVPCRDGRTPGGPFTLICHGTISRRLGLEVAVEAMDLLRERLPDVRLRILGVGEYVAEAQRIVGQRGLTDRVIFEPMVELERVPEVLCAADVGLVPNLSTAATNLMLPVKLLEYAALGVPIIAARLRTIRYYFGEDSIRYFEPGNGADLARAIEELHSDPSRGRAFAARAARAAQQLRWEEQRARFYEAVDSTHVASRRDRRSVEFKNVEPGP